MAKLEAQNKHMEVYNQGLQNGYNMAKGTASPAAFMLPSFSSPAAPGSASASTPVRAHSSVAPHVAARRGASRRLAARQGICRGGK